MNQISPSEYVALDATGLAELVHRGEVTPQSLAEAAIERIDALNPQLNAVVERSFGPARSAALVVDLKAPLAGVPFLAKDINIDVAGLRLTASCRMAGASCSPVIARTGMVMGAVGSGSPSCANIVT